MQGKGSHRTLLYTTPTAYTTFRINPGDLLNRDGAGRANFLACPTADTRVRIYRGFGGLQRLAPVPLTLESVVPGQRRFSLVISCLLVVTGKEMVHEL